MADDKTTVAEKPRDDFKRVCELEYTLVKTQNALMVIIRTLEEFANDHAGADNTTITQEDASLVYGAANLLECVAAECGRAVNGEGRGGR